MDLVLQLLWRNKLATLLGILLILLGIAYGLQSLEVSYLKARAKISDASAEASGAVVKNLEVKSAAQAEKVKASQAKVDKLTASYAEEIKRLRKAKVPAGCKQAVSWGVEQFNRLGEAP